MKYPINLLSYSCLLLLTVVVAQEPLKGDVSAVYDLIDRVLPPGGTSHFRLKLGDCVDLEPPCFRLEDTNEGNLLVTATTASELSAGIGWYLRHFANMTIGWPRGGGSNLFLPSNWATIGEKPLCKRRIVPWSYIMNVCTHSYSLVWYDWSDWERFIDWMSLSGINLMLAMTGQEEIQYKVFSKLGVSDDDIRSWFNGPAFLTWSRGQNEYGNKICGPLPRSWMKAQWDLQRKILPRLRSLGIIGQLPGFQGNVPIQLKAIFDDVNITQQGDTGWMDSLDPLFGRIADLWMETLIKDFGTDHWYQLDGYFDGSTAPWMTLREKELSSKYQNVDTGGLNTVERSTLEAKEPFDMLAFRRGTAAYTGLNRTDPDAVWSFQGWAIVGWESPKQAAFLNGFVKSAPPDKFVVIDMSTNGSGEWKQWNNASFFGAKFIWTSLHDFGGVDGMKGDLSRLNRIPFDGLSSSSVFGTGASPEGVDQNPLYYEFIFDQNFRDAPVQDLHSHTIERSHKRYNLPKFNAKVAKAWSLLVDSAYAQDVSVQDDSGIPHLPGKGYSSFENDRFTPKPVLCKIFSAWKILLETAEDSSDSWFLKEPFSYDLVNLGREVLAQISTPASLNFTDATSAFPLKAADIESTGLFYIQLLNDTDKLVATDTAFLLGPWIESARRLGNFQYDCPSEVLVDNDCGNFYEWNARVQITTWNPTPKDSSSIPGGPVDYASKHWSGLIRDYYAVRAVLLKKQALKDELVGNALNTTEVARLNAEHAYKWTTSTNKYPISSVDDFLVVSRVMLDKYERLFSSCGISSELHSTVT